MARRSGHIDKKPCTSLHAQEWTTIPSNTAKTKKTSKTRKANATDRAQNKKKTCAGNTEDYWSEISAMCVDGESLRISKEMLHDAKKFLEATDISDAGKIHFALENVHLLAARVAMLACK